MHSNTVANLASHGKRAKLEHPDQAKVAVVTGATSGLGRSCALQLAARGWTVVIIGRDQTRLDTTLRDLRRARPDVAHAAHVADLTLMDAAGKVASEIAARHPRIDLLVNNAGGVFWDRRVSREGLELTFALNHMSYFILTCRLVPCLLAADRAAILSVASNAHRWARLDWDNLQGERTFVGYGMSRRNAYGRSKLCNVLFTRALAVRMGDAIRVNCIHPGIVDSNFGNDLTGVPGLAIRMGKRILGIPPHTAAAALVALVDGADATQVTGGYFESTRLSRPSRAALDDATAERLWRVSAELSGSDLPAR